MATVIHHYCSLLSPWVFLGWPEVARITGHHGAETRTVLVDLPRVFEANGGIPGSRKSVAKRRYRLMELERWRDFRAVALNPSPAHHPFDATRATRAVIAAQLEGLAAGRAAYRLMQAVWQEDRDLSDAGTVHELLADAGLEADVVMARADGAEVTECLEANTREAIEMGVFGVPTFRLDDGPTLFWGQDRLDFLERALESAPHAPCGA